MYSLPSTSQTRAPRAFSTKNGCPPTARKARTGEFTPPGMYCNAWVNSFSDRECGIMSESASLGKNEEPAVRQCDTCSTAAGTNHRARLSLRLALHVVELPT